MAAHSSLAQVIAPCRTIPTHLNQCWHIINKILGLYSLSDKTFYRQISWSLEAARLDAAAEEPVKFQSDWKSLNTNLATSRLHEILQ